LNAKEGLKGRNTTAHGVSRGLEAKKPKPEAQDDFMEERALASGMKTEDWVIHLHH